MPIRESSETPEKLESPEDLHEEEWRKRLNSDQYQVLRESATERAFGETYEQFKQQAAGDYYCAGCGQYLFSSDQKFDSHCGWPSFWDPAEVDAVETRVDDTLGQRRIEVVCANCKGHLGHVFEGEGFDVPTDQRFCINGNVLVFVPRSA